jgi:hypothetical protein
MTTLESFQSSLTDRLISAPIPLDPLNEGDLEQRFVLPIIREVHQHFPTLRVHAHPWKHSTTCQPNCPNGCGLINAAQIHGCPKCWEASKSWAAVRLYGLHCFDVIVGSEGDSLALELKFLKRARQGNRKANDGFQRLVGQCFLARLIHGHVLGLCIAEAGALDLSATRHVADLRQQGISLLVREIQRSGGTAL